MTPAITSVGLLDADQVKSAIGAAVLAPSTHNTQPWLFRCTESGIELRADPNRALTAADPDRRELVLSCGAALFNLRTAIHALGTDPATTLLPRREDPDLLALVKPFATRRPDPRLVRLADAIPRRHTNRTPFGGGLVPPSVVNALRHAAEVEQAWLPRLNRRQIDGLLELVHKSHQFQVSDPAFLAEWRHWTRRDNRSRDGVPAYAGGISPTDNDQWVLRDFSATNGGRSQIGQAPDPLVVVIGSFADGRIDRLRAGQAMQRVLLTATEAGLDASFISQPVEVASARAELRKLLGGGLWPQIVLRFGQGEPAPWTPRRPLADVVLRSEAFNA